MPSTPRLGFEYPAVTDAPNGPAQIFALAQDVDDYITAAWSTYTPTLTAATTNPTLGSSPTQVGKYKRLGSLVFVRFFLSFGTSGASAGSGSYRINLPVTATAQTRPLPVGSGWLYDASAGALRLCVFTQLTTSTAEVYSDTGTVSNSAPWAWANSDEIAGEFRYEAGF